MVDRPSALGLLRMATGDPSSQFRDGQWDAIDALVNRRERLLVVQRTGWGKSSVYFVATRILRGRSSGPTLIISPLLALMRNQIEAAERLGLNALSINSTNQQDWPEIKRSMRQGEVDVLLISPERLANDEFVEHDLMPIANRIGLLVVDEVHCISDWGHDFRPDYRRLVNVVKRIPRSVPILGTTATANDRVVNDTQAQLGDIGIQRGSLMRKSLVLQTFRMPSQAARLAWLARHVPSLPGTGIIYTLTKRDAQNVAGWLSQNGVSARAYYSGVVSDEFENSDTYRQHLEKQLSENKIKALVATTALGMGYDKPDLGFVIHYQAPGSIVAYYQQVGRAGRGIEQAYGILLTGNEDNSIHEYFRQSAFPKESWVAKILGALETSDGMTVRQLEREVNLRYGQIEKVTKFLSVEERAPVIKMNKMWHRTPVPYRMDHNKIRRLTEQRESEWSEVEGYIDGRGCLMMYLAKFLDDAVPRPCGKCSSCCGRPVVEPSYPHELSIKATRFLRHSELELKCNIQVAAESFPKYGFRGNLRPELRAESGRILSRWRDAGWGRFVANDKQDGRFRDELVEAVEEMITERWCPKPRPRWVTCVPSIEHPDLVPDFAVRLARELDLPFSPIVRKVRNNKPQKEQQNRFHQCRNLDGVFSIADHVRETPVLLVDDVVDSGWTLTVVAALLRESGSGPVWPLALATSNMGA